MNLCPAHFASGRQVTRGGLRTIVKRSESGVVTLAAEIEARLAGMAGSTTEELRRVRREYSRRLKNAKPHMVIELAERLLHVPRMDYRFVAYELIHHHSGALLRLNAKQLERLGRGIASWGAVDSFAVYLVGPAWRARRS